MMSCWPRPGVFLRVRLAAMTILVVALSAGPALAGSEPLPPPPVTGSGSQGYYQVSAANMVKAGGVLKGGLHGTPHLEYVVRWAYDCPLGKNCRVSPDGCALSHAGQQGDWRSTATYLHRSDRPLPPAQRELWDTQCLNWVYIHPAPDPKVVWDQVKHQLPGVRWLPQPPADHGHPALINFPVIFHIDAPAPTPQVPDFVVAGQRIHVTVAVQPGGYGWDFEGSGQFEWFDGPGHPYVHGDTCDRRSCDGYVTHAYATTGTFHVRPRMRWDVTFTADGGPEQPIPGDLYTDGPPQDISTVQSHGVLVSGGSGG